MSREKDNQVDTLVIQKKSKWSHVRKVAHMFYKFFFYFNESTVFHIFKTLIYSLMCLFYIVLKCTMSFTLNTHSLFLFSWRLMSLPEFISLTQWMLSVPLIHLTGKTCAEYRHMRVTLEMGQFISQHIYIIGCQQLSVRVTWTSYESLHLFELFQMSQWSRFWFIPQCIIQCTCPHKQAGKKQHWFLCKNNNDYRNKKKIVWSLRWIVQYCWKHPS